MIAIINKRNRVSKYRVANINVEYQDCLFGDSESCNFHIFADLTDDTGQVKQSVSLQLTKSELEALIIRLDAIEYDHYYTALVTPAKEIASGYHTRKSQLHLQF